MRRFSAKQQTVGIPKMMDSLPPNDPNRSSKNHAFQSVNGQQQQAGERYMDLLGNMEDSPVVVAMFLIGVVTWFLRDHCSP
jgi:hypothetical protein